MMRQYIYIIKRENLVKKNTTQFLTCVFAHLLCFLEHSHDIKVKRFLFYGYKEDNCSFWFEISKNEVFTLEKDVKK